MRSNRWAIACALLAALVLGAASAGASTLDREGTAPEVKDYFTCHTPFDFESAGGKPNFNIHLNGFCGIHPGGGLPGWTPVDWEAVTVFGRYYYDTSKAYEVVRVNGQVAVEVYLESCSKNPWVWGPWVGGRTCTVSTLIDNTNVNLLDPRAHLPDNPPPAFPLSAARMSGQVAVALREWEENYPAADELADWNPYAPETGSSGLQIESPSSFQIFTVNTPSFQLDLKTAGSAQPPQTVLIQWERLEETPEWVGDLHMPSDKTHMWQPFYAEPEGQWADFPLAIAVNPGYFANKRGLYQLRVKGSNDSGWTPWRQFWIGQPTFDPDEVLGITQQAGQAQMFLNTAMLKSFNTSASEKTMKEVPSKALKAPGFGSKVTVKSGQAPGGSTPEGARSMAAAKTQPTGVKASPKTLRKTGAPETAALSEKTLAAGNLKVPKVVVEGVNVEPTPTRAGKRIKLSITLLNAGTAAKSGQQFKVNCAVKSGGPSCIIPESTQTVTESIAPGETQIIVLKSNVKAAAGKYKVTVTPDPGSPDGGKTVTVDVTEVRRVATPEAARQAPVVKEEEEKNRIRTVPQTIIK